jgi:hypothetical protein
LTRPAVPRRARRPRARPSLFAPAALLLLAPVLGSCGRDEARVDPSGIVRAAGPLDLGGRAHGAWTLRYPDGEVREQGAMVHGQREGTWTDWYPVGQRRSRGARRYDPERGASPREGAWRFWYANGVLRGEGSYVDGLPEGPWRWWNHEGRFDAERSGDYRAGVRTGPLEAGPRDAGG